MHDDRNSPAGAGRGTTRPGCAVDPFNLNSDFEKTLRKFEFTPQGLRVGAPMTHLAGMLGGTHDLDVEISA